MKMLIRPGKILKDWFLGTPVTLTGYIAAKWVEVKKDLVTTVWYRESELQEVEFNESLVNQRYLYIDYNEYREVFVLSGHVYKAPGQVYYGSFISDETINLIPASQLIRITKVSE